MDILTPLTLPEITSAPGSPATGKVSTYAKTDGYLYTVDSNGVERQQGGGGTVATGYGVETGITLKSENGTNYLLTVTDDGHLFTRAV